MNENKTLMESEHYHVDSVFSEAEPTGTYHVINRETGVVEVVTAIYPQALSYIDQFEDHLAQLKKTKVDEQVGGPIVVEAVH